MDELKKLTQRFNELVVQLRAADKEENPDKAKVANIEEEIRSLSSKIETERAILRTSGVDPEVRAVVPAAGKNASEEEKRAAVLNYMRTGREINLRDMTSGMTSGGDTGGYLIPQEWERQILENERENFVMRSLCDVQTSALDKIIPAADDYGEADWIPEGADYPESNASFSQKEMSAYKVGRIYKISRELLYDNTYNLEQWMINTTGYTIGLAMEKAYINGDGNKKPRGILIDAEAVASAGATIVYDDFLKMFSSLKSGYFTRANWLMNTNTLVEIMKLKDSSGAYIYKPFDSAEKSNSPIGAILQRPINISSQMPDIGAGKKPVLFGDFKRYRIQDREGITIRRLNELFAKNGFIGFQADQRTDGKLLIPEAVKALTIPGAGTQSAKV